MSDLKTISTQRVTPRLTVQVQHDTLLDLYDVQLLDSGVPLSFLGAALNQGQAQRRADKLVAALADILNTH